MEVITIGNNKCYNANDRIDLSKYFNLKNVSIGNNCFFHQDVLNLTGLHSLDRVMIGEYSFQKSSGNNANRKLYVKNCDALKELKIGRYSFSDYSVIEIENVDKLEVLEIGSYDKNGKSFDHAPLELRSGYDGVIMMDRLTEIEITSIWLWCILLFPSSCVRE